MNLCTPGEVIDLKTIKCGLFEVDKGVPNLVKSIRKYFNNWVPTSLSPLLAIQFRNRFYPLLISVKYSGQMFKLEL